MVERRHDLIVIGVDEEEKWCVGGSRHIVRRAGIDGSGKIGSAIRIVVKRHGCGDVAASGETKNPDAVAGDAPLWGVRADEAYRLLSVGDRERDDGLPTLRLLRSSSFPSQAQRRARGESPLVPMQIPGPPAE